MIYLDNSADTSLGVRDGYFHWERQRQTSEEEASSTKKDAEEDSEDPQNQQKDWNGTLWLENINLHILKVGVIFDLYLIRSFIRDFCGD